MAAAAVVAAAVPRIHVALHRAQVSAVAVVLDSLAAAVVAAATTLAPGWHLMAAAAAAFPQAVPVAPTIMAASPTVKPADSLRAAMADLGVRQLEAADWASGSRAPVVLREEATLPPAILATMFRASQAGISTHHLIMI